MTPHAALLRQFRSAHLPVAMLITLLQRAPASRVLSIIEDLVTASPAGSLLKSAAAVAASLGTLNSLAGASETVVADPATQSLGTVGQGIHTPTGGVEGLINFTASPYAAASFSLSGNLPPGLTFTDSNEDVTLTGPGVVNNALVVIFGTPTTAGVYTITMTAWQDANAMGDSLAYPFTFIISPAPTGPGGAAITTQPMSQTVATGATLTLTVVASNATSYQWLFNGSDVSGANVSGATTATLTITAITASQAGNYTVNCINSSATQPSIAAVITVSGPATPAPAFTTNPQGQATAVGQTVTFTAAASGSPTYQWFDNGTAISGATNATLTLTNVQLSAAGTYTVTATNAGGSVTSTSAVLTVSATSAPAFTTNPQSQTVVSGTTVVFNSATTGAPTPTFQWKLNGAAISGATSARLVVSGATSANAGQLHLCRDQFE